MCDDCKLFYLAGIIDGEGTVRVSKSVNGLRFKYNVYLSVFNSDLKLLEFLSNFFGGHINLVRKETEKHKAGYQLCWTGKNAKDVLEKVRDKCVIKLPQIEVALLLPVFGHGKARWIESYSDEELAVQEVIYQAMKQLNKKGPRKLVQEKVV